MIKSEWGLNKPIWFVGKWELKYPIFIVYTKEEECNKGQDKGWR